MENLSWSLDYILNTCEDSLRDKVQEGLVGVSEMECGGPMILKKMLDIVMNVYDAALCFPESTNAEGCSGGEYRDNRQLLERGPSAIAELCSYSYRCHMYSE